MKSFALKINYQHGGAGYTTLANDLYAFHKLGHLPKTIKLDRRHEDDDFESTFQKQHAKIHKSCSLKCIDHSLQRARNKGVMTKLMEYQNSLQGRK